MTILQENESGHSFHIPVMGTAFTIDTPVKLGRFGISSVISLCDDELCETMGLHYAALFKKSYISVDKSDKDYRAKRIQNYLNLVNDIVSDQIKRMKEMSFEHDNDLVKYFELLPEKSPLGQLYKDMLASELENEKKLLQDELKKHIYAGSIDANIMTKLDRDNFDQENNPLSQEYSDALAALRGFATSNLRASIVFSAGFNRRLYSYIEQFDDFYPDKTGFLKKKVVLKVSDFRSALTQGKFLAKKGIWVSEYRIESGLNCGGHAFATDGYLLGPILEEFKTKRVELGDSLLETCNEALQKKNKVVFNGLPDLKVTVQGGIGTGKEQAFLLSYFEVDRTGWASPFLLVEEATTLDEKTRTLLCKAGKDDFYLSGISPLGVPFNTVRGTESEEQKLDRYKNGRPGSPCPKGYLVSNTEYSKKPVCTASVFYQRRKLKELETLGLEATNLEAEKLKVINKACLCEDLAAGALTINNIDNERPLKSAVCPGPNLAYFSRFFSLKEMVNHIYDKINLLNDVPRSNMFISELKMYIDYFKNELKSFSVAPNDRQLKTLIEFRNNLFEGIEYYKSMIPEFVQESVSYREIMKQELLEQYQILKSISIQYQDELQVAAG
jgi:hypothetical protein